MTVEYIRYTIPAERSKAFESDYAEAFRELDASPYCRGHELTQCVEDAQAYTVRLLWTSVDDHMQKFRQSAEFRTFFQHIRSYVNQIEEMRHYHPVDGSASN